MNGMKHRNQTRRSYQERLTWFLCLLLVCLLPIRSYGAEAIDPSRKASLTVVCRYGDAALPGARVRLYRAGDVSETAQFTLSGAFSTYPVVVNGIKNASGWDAAAGTLAGYAAADEIAVSATGKTDAAGSLGFRDLEAGLYLVTVDRLQIGINTYVFSPFLVSLPDLGTEGNWLYDVSAYPKCSRIREETTDPGGNTPGGEKNVSNYQVVKHWMDEGHTDKRPVSVEISILRDGKLYRSESLSSENQWTFRWSVVNDRSTWQVVERNVADGYTVTAEGKDMVLILTNTYAEEIPQPPIRREHLPQTGLLWWPVPLLAGGGMVLFGMGWRMSRRGKDEDEAR